MIVKFHYSAFKGLNDRSKIKSISWKAYVSANVKKYLNVLVIRNLIYLL